MRKKRLAIKLLLPFISLLLSSCGANGGGFTFGDRDSFSYNHPSHNSSIEDESQYAKGERVFDAFYDTQDYDLIVEKENILKRVQVKATSCKTKSGNYQVALKSCGGTKGTTYKRVIETNVEELFIVTENINIYIIPILELKNKSTISICDKYSIYKVK